MEKYYTSFSKLISVILLLSLTACEDFLEVDNPKTELVREDVFNSDLTATAVIASLYTKLSSNSGSLNSITYLGPLLADEALFFGTDINTAEFNTNNIVASNGLVNLIWSNWGYTNIYHANTLLEGLEDANKVSPATRTQLTGEALFLRAFFNFYLTNLFGAIPLVTTTDYRNNARATRTLQEDVYIAIIGDLEEARAKLPQDFTPYGNERIRPTTWAATALLARAHLYSESWSEAEQEATLLINSEMFRLTTLNEVFLKNSAEAIWQLKPTGSTANTNEATNFIATTTPRNSALGPDFVDAFETNDMRASSWIGNITVGMQTYWFPFKYKVRTGPPAVEYSMVLRLAEQFLIRAEARTQQDNLEGAIDDVDVIRVRAGLPPLRQVDASITKDELLGYIASEKRVEFFSEWGHRWLDLKRTNKVDQLNTVKPGWNTNDQWLPIPATEVLVNPNLQQNPGY